MNYIYSALEPSTIKKKKIGLFLWTRVLQKITTKSCKHLMLYIISGRQFIIIYSISKIIQIPCWLTTTLYQYPRPTVTFYYRLFINYRIDWEKVTLIRESKIKGKKGVSEIPDR